MGMGLYGRAILLFRRSEGPTTGVVISSPTAGVVQFMLKRIDEYTIFLWEFKYRMRYEQYEQYDTKLEAKLHLFKIGSFIGRPRVNTGRPSSFKNEKK